MVQRYEMTKIMCKVWRVLSVYNSVYLYINIARYFYHLNVHTYIIRYLRIVAAIYKIKIMKHSKLYCVVSW